MIFELMKLISKIQYITRYHSELSHAEQARLMYQNGVSWVQLRIKDATEEEILAEAKIAMQYAKELGGTLIINDNVGIANEINAHGVHLGLNDMKPSAARLILGEHAIIGGTANTFSQVKQQIDEGVDYVGLGPFRYTKTKNNLSPVIGEAGYKEILSELHQNGLTIPIVAVGGISIDDFDQLNAIGLHGAAVSKALFEAVYSGTFQQMNLIY